MESCASAVKATCPHSGPLCELYFAVTVTLKLAVVLCPKLSVAVRVTVVVPSGKLEPRSNPGVGADVTVIGKVLPLASVAVGIRQRTVASVSLLFLVVTNISDGTLVITGDACVPIVRTVTVKLSVVTLPSLSVAL